MGLFQFEGAVGHGAVRIGNHAGLADAEKIVIGDKSYEWESAGGVTAGAVAVAIGANAAADIQNLVNAINANKPSRPVTAYIDPIDTAVCRFQADDEGDRGNLDFTTTMADPANIIDAVAGKMRGGENAGNQKLHRGKYVVSALDVAAGNLMIPTGHQAPKHMQIDAWSASGLQKALTTLFTFDGTRIKGDFDGATNPVAGDVIEWQAWG